VRGQHRRGRRRQRVGSIIAGAGVVVAVDVNPARHEVAKSFGATHFVDAGGPDVAAALREATDGRGVDKVLLCADVIPPAQFGLAVDGLAPGGTVVQVGVTGGTLDHIPVAPSALMRKQASLTATTYGGLDPARDSLRWLELYRAGRLPLDRFVTRTYPLADINRGFEDMAAGRNIRGVIVYDQD
jgi:Zn-dependent alcohol dehydrogenase